MSAFNPEEFDWQRQGACADLPKAAQDDFFPEGKFVPKSEEYYAAVTRACRLCTRCPVQAPCLQFALGHDIRYGIWGGLTANGRRELKYPRNKQDTDDQDRGPESSPMDEP